MFIIKINKMDDNGLSDLKDSENDWDLDINIDEKDN